MNLLISPIAIRKSLKNKYIFFIFSLLLSSSILSKEKDNNFENCLLVSNKFWEFVNPDQKFITENCSCAVKNNIFFKIEDEKYNNKIGTSLLECSKPNFKKTLINSGWFNSLEKDLRNKKYSRERIDLVITCHSKLIYSSLYDSFDKGVKLNLDQRNFVACY
jgi:hypothetical protein